MNEPTVPTELMGQIPPPSTSCLVELGTLRIQTTRSENPARKRYWPFWSKVSFPSVTLKAKYVLLCWSGLLPAVMMNAGRRP